MKIKIIMLYLILSISLLTACGSKGSKKNDEVKLSDEFTLEQKELEGVIKKINVLFAAEVTKAKVSALSADKRGASLGYVLDQDETEKLINLFQKEEIKAVEVSQSEYNSTATRDNYGYRVEFVDSMDRFYPGASRLTCFTTTNYNYLAVIGDGGGTQFYRIGLTDEIISFLNEASSNNYKASRGRTGWFDKVFNQK
ncbi:MAG: hypothetical protein ACTTG8_05050 [Catonella sp.]|uniref:hypothetical protein n=1 Tax=Catonella sp. TaxID=2382125 RepID=UPI003F9F832C